MFLDGPFQLGAVYDPIVESSRKQLPNSQISLCPALAFPPRRTRPHAPSPAPSFPAGQERPPGAPAAPCPPRWHCAGLRRPAAAAQDWATCRASAVGARNCRREGRQLWRRLSPLPPVPRRRGEAGGDSRLPPPARPPLLPPPRLLPSPRHRRGCERGARSAPAGTRRLDEDLRPGAFGSLSGMRRTAGTQPCPEAERGHQVTARLAPSRPGRKVACSPPGERRGEPRAPSGRVRGGATAARAVRAAVRCGRGEGKGRGTGGPSWQHWR